MRLPQAPLGSPLCAVFGHNIVEELEDDLACLCAADLDVKKNLDRARAGAQSDIYQHSCVDPPSPSNPKMRHITEEGTARRLC
jgi:hypothetical protein